MIDPTVHVRPYMANASVEFVSSVMSPIAALTVATLPFSAPLMDRIAIIIQKFDDRPLRTFQHPTVPGVLRNSQERSADGHAQQTDDDHWLATYPAAGSARPGSHTEYITRRTLIASPSGRL